MIKIENLNYKYKTGNFALSNINLQIENNEFISIIGKNGSGKSTFSKLISGLVRFKEGKILIDNLDLSDKKQTLEIRKNVAIVFQNPETQIIFDKVYDDLAFGLKNLGFSKNEIDIRIEQALKQVNMLDFKNSYTTELSLGQKQRIAIASALAIQPKVLILDEPTSSLDDSEVEKLFQLMTKLKREGVGIIFVTHFLEQVYAVCDKITVLRNGQLVGQFTTAELPRVQLVAKMMGKDFDDLASIKGDTAKEFSEKEEDITIKAVGLGKSGYIKPFDLVIHKGEVLGFTGLLGSGRSETVRLLYGAEKADTGELFVKGQKVVAKHPLTSMNAGMAYLPEDRKNEGIIADLSVRENLILALQAKRGVFHLISKKQQEEFTDKYIKMLQVKTASRETTIKSLSGGNQQKVIIGRWLLTNPDFLILDEPTRGIDIGTKTEIQKLVLQLAEEGMAVVFISSEIEEMLRTCDRMVVMRDGAKVGELSGEDMNQSTIMSTIAGGH